MQCGWTVKIYFRSRLRCRTLKLMVNLSEITNYTHQCYLQLTSTLSWHCWVQRQWMLLWLSWSTGIWSKVARVAGYAMPLTKPTPHEGQSDGCVTLMVYEDISRGLHTTVHVHVHIAAIVTVRYSNCALIGTCI